MEILNKTMDNFTSIHQNVENNNIIKSRYFLESIGKFFYIVPYTETYENIYSVPNYYVELFPLFLGLVFAEFLCLALKGKIPRLGESLNSLSHGIISETFKLLTMGIEISIYIYIHENFKLVDLAWENPLTWYLALLGVDFAYYWAHRASHEVNFLWAQHSVHHSSEDFNIAVAVRHPVTHNWINSFFYLPLALIVPPAQCIAHQQLNLIYQGWIHSSLIGSLGPLEYIFNTPTHHKVHHGCNLYVLDKNYGGFLIIWDRIFGTFQDMKKDEEIVFGIVFQHKSFNPFWQMWHKFPGLYNWAKSQKNWTNYLKAIFWGPSWIPDVNAPRLGRDEDKFDVKPREKFRVELPLWLNLYLIFHFFAICLVFQEFALRKSSLDQFSIGMTVFYILISLTSIGFLSEGNSWAATFELCRCIFFTTISIGTLEPFLSFYFIPSALIWLFITKNTLKQRKIKTN